MRGTRSRRLGSKKGELQIGGLTIAEWQDEMRHRPEWDMIVDSVLYDADEVVVALGHRDAAVRTVACHIAGVMNVSLEEMSRAAPLLRELGERDPDPTTREAARGAHGEVARWIERERAHTPAKRGSIFQPRPKTKR